MRISTLAVVGLLACTALPSSGEDKPEESRITTETKIFRGHIVSQDPKPPTDGKKKAKSYALINPAIALWKENENKPLLPIDDKTEKGKELIKAFAGKKQSVEITCTCKREVSPDGLVSRTFTIDSFRKVDGDLEESPEQVDRQDEFHGGSEGSEYRWRMACTVVASADGGFELVEYVSEETRKQYPSYAPEPLPLVMDVKAKDLAKKYAGTGTVVVIKANRKGGKVDGPVTLLEARVLPKIKE